MGLCLCKCIHVLYAKTSQIMMDQEIITNTVANNFCNVLTQLKFGKCEISTKTFLEYFPFKNAKLEAY